LKEFVLMVMNRNGTYENDHDKIAQVRVRARVKIMTENGVGGDAQN